jgi:predicted Zn-dependent peptidase
LAARDGLRTTALSTEGSGDVEPDLDVSDDDDIADGPPIAAMAWAPETKRARVTVLANGLTVIAMRRPGLPFASMLLGFHGEPQPDEVPGVRSALNQTWLWNLKPVPIDRGVVHMTMMQPDSYQESMTMFSVDAARAIDIVAEQPDRLQIQWPSHPFERWLQAEAQTEALPHERARRAFRAALFGDHVYRLTPTLDAVRTVTAADLQAWLQRNRRPSNGALIIVGDVDVDEMTRRAARQLASWTGDATARLAPDPPVVPASRRARPEVLFTRDASRRSTEVRFGCLLPPVKDLAGDVRSDVLASLAQDDLRRGLRMQLGASYSPGVAASTRRGGIATLEGGFDIDDAALPAALEVLRGWLDPARPLPLRPAAFERARRNHARRSVFHAATNGAVARNLFYAWNLGWPLAALDDYPNVLARMTIAEIGVDLAACRTSAVISVLGRGPMPPTPGIIPASSN